MLSQAVTVTLMDSPKYGVVLEMLTVTPVTAALAPGT